MTDLNNMDMENTQNEECLDAVDEEEYCEDYEQSPLSAAFENYCDNLAFPDEDKCIDPKKMYITLGAAFAGAVLIFLFIGWLLCYCPLRTTGYSAEEFIAEYNAIVSDGDVGRDEIDLTVAMMASSSDVTVLYPDFSDMTIPEDADLEKGVLLCDGNMLVQADLVGGDIQKLTVSVTEGNELFDWNVWTFIKDNSVDFDYSGLSYYAAAGKARLAFYNLVSRENGVEPVAYTLSDAISYCMGMLQGSYYSFAEADDYDPNHSYFEYSSNLILHFTPNNFCFTADSRETTIIDSDNGLYRFYDSIFGKDDEAKEKTSTDPAASGNALSASDAQ